MYFDSPFELCPVCGQHVLLDQTQAECAREHHCDGVECPLAKHFTGKAFTESDVVAPEESAEKG